MAKSRIPNNFCIAAKSSALSRITPNNLTPTHKMILARARIWNEVIGGNEQTGLKYARGILKGDSMLKYFKYAFEEFYTPFEPDDEEDNDTLDEYRELRRSRRGKFLYTEPKRKFEQVPRRERKRFLFREFMREEQITAKKNLASK
jgi:hypothetical protein